MVRLLVMKKASLGLTFVDGVCGLVHLWWKEDVGCLPIQVMMVLDGGGSW